MSGEELIQGSVEWLHARAGSLGASQVALALAKTKSGWGASRANIMATMIAERLTGSPAESFSNAAMIWGIETEPQARIAYQFYTSELVTEVGLVKHPNISGTHASPDGLVGSAGLLELKAPNTATHLDTLLSDKVPKKYVTQMMWQMACCERSWCDFASFDPRLPENMRLWVKRIERDDKLIADLEKDVTDFLRELGDKVTALTKKYGTQEDA